MSGARPGAWRPRGGWRGKRPAGGQGVGKQRGAGTRIISRPSRGLPRREEDTPRPSPAAPATSGPRGRRLRPARVVLGTLWPSWGQRGSQLGDSHPGVSRDSLGTPELSPSTGRERSVPSPAGTKPPWGPPRPSSANRERTSASARPPWRPRHTPGTARRGCTQGSTTLGSPELPGASGEGTPGETRPPQRRRGGDRSQPCGRAPGLPARRGRKPHPGPVSRARPRVPVAPRARSGRHRYRGGGGDTPGDTGRAPGA